MKDMHNRGTQYVPVALRKGRGSKGSEGPKTKIEKRNRACGNPRNRHIYTHAHGHRLYPAEFAAISAEIKAIPGNWSGSAAQSSAGESA
jgi:hypothetical protein